LSRGMKLETAAGLVIVVASSNMLSGLAYSSSST
jgi:hypothetical protein